MPQWDPKKLQDWHLRVIDILIADPTLTSEEIAFELKNSVHPMTINILRRTDLFKMALDARRNAISDAIDANTIQSIQGKLGRLASSSLDTLTMQIEREKLQELANPSKQTTETCEMALRGLGIIRGGGAAAPTVSVNQTTVVQVDNSTLIAAREKMRDVHARPLQLEPDRAALPAPVAARAGR